MRNVALMMSLALSLMLVACGGESSEVAGATGEAAGMVKKAMVKTSSPEAAIESIVANLRGNNVLGVMESMVPPDGMETVRADYIKERDAKEITDEERAQFNETMQKLTADGAEDALVAEMSPLLAEMGPQLPMYMAIGQMAVSSSIQGNAELSAEQKEQATTSMNAAFKAIQDADIANPDLMQMAVGKACAAARAMELTSLDDLRALDFDQAVGKASIAVGGLKDVLSVYGMSLDETLDSVEAKKVSEDGDSAMVEVSYSLFGSPVTGEVEMTKIDGNWYVKDLIDEMNSKEG